MFQAFRLEFSLMQTVKVSRIPQQFLFLKKHITASWKI